MKRVITIAVLVMISISAFAQNGKSIYNKYSDTKGANCVYISPAMFNLVGKIPDLKIGDDDVDLTPIIKSLEGLYIVNSSNADVCNSIDKDVKKFVENGKFEKLMEVKDDGETVMIYTIKQGNFITAFVMLASEPGETTFICIDGKIAEKDLMMLMERAMKS